jgi:hypothetical protein
VWIGLRPGTGHGWLVGRSMVAVPLTVGTDIQYASWRLDSPTMSGPSKESSPSGHEHDSLLMRVKRLRRMRNHSNEHWRKNFARPARSSTICVSVRRKDGVNECPRCSIRPERSGA